MYSTISHTGDGKSIKPGDRGIVQGPCGSTDGAADHVRRVLVEFDNGLRINILADTQLSKYDPTIVRPAYIARPHVLQATVRDKCVFILR